MRRVRCHAAGALNSTTIVRARILYRFLMPHIGARRDAAGAGSPARSCRRTTPARQAILRRRHRTTTARTTTLPADLSSGIATAEFWQPASVRLQTPWVGLSWVAAWGSSSSTSSMPALPRYGDRRAGGRHVGAGHGGRGDVGASSTRSTRAVDDLLRVCVSAPS